MNALALGETPCRSACDRASSCQDASGLGSTAACSNRRLEERIGCALSEPSTDTSTEVVPGFVLGLLHHPLPGLRASTMWESEAESQFPAWKTRRGYGPRLGSVGDNRDGAVEVGEGAVEVVGVAPRPLASVT